MLNIPLNAQIKNVDITGIGYGYVSDVYGPDAVGINPSFLADIEGEWFSVSLIKPFVFHNISFALGISRNIGVGLHIMQDEDFNLYSTAVGINMLDFIDLGVMLSLQRELISFKNNFSISPGFNISLKTYRRKSPFDMNLGLFAENLIAGDNLLAYKYYSKLDIIYGLSFSILLKELRFYLGGEYFDTKNHISFSADYNLFRILNLRGGMNSEKEVLLGLKFGNSYNYLSVGSKIQKEPSDIFYSISYTRSITTGLEQREQVRSIKRVSRRTLNKQKELIERGLNYYREKDYTNAKEEWQKAYNLAPESKYGQEARKYLQRVERILKQIGE